MSGPEEAIASSSNLRLDDTLPNEPNDDTTEPSPQAYDELSEAQLREIYDSEEIEHFLSIFSAYVTEVRIPGVYESTSQSAPSTSNRSVAAEVVYDGPSESEDQEWVPVGLDAGASQSLATGYTRSSSWSVSEEIAFRFLLPILPEAPLPSPTFTFGRLRLACQRLYLAVEPVYIPFFMRLAKLAIWEDLQESFFYCVMYWALWFYDLLLPALVLRILCALVKRRVFSYPTLAELQEHRLEIERAHKFGEEVSSRFSASSTLGIKEIWRMAKVVKKTTEMRARDKVKEYVIFEPSEDSDAASPDGPESASNTTQSLEEKQVQDFRNMLLSVMNEVTDLHERIKNLFIWRRPESSMIYGGVLSLLFCFTLFVPSRYIVKSVYLLVGLIFWHIVPVIHALPPTARSRLPPAFADLPTDADYAMELISKRVAAGQDVKPPQKRKYAKDKDKSRSQVNGAEDGSSERSPSSPRESKEKGKDNEIDWKKWGERAAIGHVWAQQGKRLFAKDKHTPQVSESPPRSNVVPPPSVAIGQPRLDVNTHTFPCQHSSAPGLITLTPTMLLFTPLMALDAKLAIPFRNIVAVKKAGLLKGVYVRWRRDEDGSELNEKFPWVGGRDELFARLVGSENRRWLKA